jgi:selenocysteine lyase/cysteine desulfurase
LAITAELRRWAVSRPGYTVLTPERNAQRAGIVAVRTPDVAADSAKLRTAGVVHSIREGAIRLAPHFHSTREDLQRVFRALES